VKIITHPGYRHADETLGLCLIAYYLKDHFEIHFRNPTQEELDDAQVWVLDIGGSYDPSKLNFDHHQDINLNSSYRLISKFLDFDKVLSHNPWWDVKDEFDRFGPSFVANKYFNGKSTFPLISPFEEWFLGSMKYDENQVLYSHEPKAKLLIEVGKYLIETGTNIQNNIGWLKEHAAFYPIGSGGAEVCIAARKNLLGKDYFLKYAYESGHPNVVALCHHDERGNGWAMYRLKDLLIDFNRIRGKDGVGFVHLNGFTGRTLELIPEEDVVNFVKQSYIGN
jgi:hypothetical protein